VKTIKQGYRLTAAHDFAFRNPVTKRLINVKCGDRFAVTNNQTDQRKAGLVKMDREKQASLGSGWYFSWDDVCQYFGANNLPPSYFHE
jgi:hypothetical protein